VSGADGRACMRKLVMIVYGVLKNRAPFDPNGSSRIAPGQHATLYLPIGRTRGHVPGGGRPTATRPARPRTSWAAAPAPSRTQPEQPPAPQAGFARRPAARGAAHPGRAAGGPPGVVPGHAGRRPGARPAAGLRPEAQGEGEAAEGRPDRRRPEVATDRQRRHPGWSALGCKTGDRGLTADTAAGSALPPALLSGRSCRVPRTRGGRRWRRTWPAAARAPRPTRTCPR